MNIRRILQRLDLAPSHQPFTRETQRTAASRRRTFKRQLLLESLEHRRVLNGEWTNPKNALDVNADRSVTPIDALIIINELNKSFGRISDEDGRLPVPPSTFSPPPFLDVNRDGFVKPIDALIIVNGLSRDSGPPVISLTLLNDTAPEGTNSDQLTADGRIQGTVIDQVGVRELVASVDNRSPVLVSFNADGSFVFDPGFRNGGEDDGEHTVRFVATDARGLTSAEFPLTFELDTLPPSLSLDLQPAFDTGLLGDHVTRFGQVSFAGSSEANAVVKSPDLDIELLVGSDGQFTLSDIPLRFGDNLLQLQVSDSAGNSAQRATRVFRSSTDTAFGLVESTGMVTEQLLTVAIGPVGPARTLEMDLNLFFDHQASKAFINDILNVFVVDATEPSNVLLASNLPGGAIAQFSENELRLAPGLVSINGTTLSIDVSSIAATDVQLRFQLLSGDDDAQSLVVVDDTRVAGNANTPLTALPIPVVTPGAAMTLDGLAPIESVDIKVEHTRFDLVSQQLVASLSLENQGVALGRDIAVVIRGLPSGVSLPDSAATLEGSPVLNLRPAIPPGGLATGQRSELVELRIDNPNNQRFHFAVDVLAGPPNHAPELAAIDPLTLFPGEVQSIRLNATDSDGDPLQFSIIPLSGSLTLPNIALSADGQITLRPLADLLGSFQFEVHVSDGVASVSQVVQLNIISDTIATTRISGVVQDIQQRPLDGVPVEIAGFATVTQADGSFTIVLPTLEVPTESLNVAVPAGDPMLDPFNTGTQEIVVRRARHDVTTGDRVGNQRQHPNLVSSFIDASMVYGSDLARANALRTMVDGKLKTSGEAGELLPRNNANTFPDGVLENDNAGREDPATLFATGDVRANENVALLSMHTLLVREHNRLADEIKLANPSFSDEEIYQQARRLVGALIQHITYTEYLPLLVGENAIPAYGGYNASADPSISALFSTAAFRLGHTQINSLMSRLDADGNSLPSGPLTLRGSFFTTQPITDDGIEPLLRGLVATTAQETDVHVIDDVRNMLFGPPGSGGSDLASVSIQRGRDLGLPTYNQARIDFGLAPITTFAQVSSDANVQAALREAYGNVDKIDAFVGGLAEDHVPGAVVGPLLAAIIADQFTRSRDGDRFWFENEQFTATELQQIRSTSMKSLIERNTTITGLPLNVFTTGDIPEPPAPAGSAADAASDLRSIDGTGNNLSNPPLGSTGTNLLENFTRQYGDDLGSPGGQDRPNPRVISNLVHDQTTDLPSNTGITSMFVFWGQFLDHDISLTPGGVDNTLKILGQQRPNPSGDEAYPFVAERMTLLIGHDVIPGVNNVIERPIFLPSLDGGTTIDPTKDMTVAAENIANATVFVAANTLQDRGGNSFADELSITEVPSDLTPAALPRNLFPDLVVTIQPADLVFTTPAPLTLPNRTGFPAGTKFDLHSINPLTGEFDIVGTGEVSGNGQRIETIDGGIRNSSWHFFVAQTPPAQEQANNDPANNPRNQDQLCDDCEGKARTSGQSVATSDVELHSGALLEEHFLVTYQSLGIERGVSLHYDSLRADPRPIFHFNTVNVSGDETLVGSLNVSRGNLSVEVPGFVGNEFGLQGGEHFWNLPAGTNNVGAALQVDLRDQPTGVYTFDLTFGPRRFNGTRFAGSASQFSAPVSIINSINSPFGAGWDLAGLQQLFENPDGSVMLVDGSGTELLFRPPLTGRTFESPAGDFSIFERLSDGTFRRTFTDQTVVQFNADNRIESVTDRNGNQTVYNYDVDGFVTSLVDPVGLVTTFTRTGDRITKITDPASRKTNLEFDAFGNLIRITDPDGSSRQFFYDELHHLIAEVDQRGFREEASYGFHGRVVEALRKDGTRSVFEPVQTIGLFPSELTSHPDTAPEISVDSGQAVASFADPNGNVTTSVLDQAGQIVSQADPEGNLPAVVRNRDNLFVVSNDGRGNATYRKFDDRGNVIQVALEQNERSPTMFDGPVLLSHDRVEMVRLGDLDGDGDLDAVAGHGTTLNGSGSSQFVTIFKNDNGRLIRELDLQVFNAGTENIALADVDGDNILDILIATGDSANDRFRVMKGNGDLTFGFLSSIALTLDPTSLAVGDVNGDGSPDVVLSRGSSSDALLLINDGAGTFTESALPTGDRTFDVRLADVNGDGNLDAVFAGIVGVRLLIGDGAGGFSANVKLNTGSQTHDAVEVLDFNNDGRLDIISTAIFGVIQFFENDGAGGFIESAITVLVSGRLNDIAVADINFDGFQDFVLSNTGSANSSDAARVFLNDGLGRFSNQPQFVRSGTTASSVALGDLDQDGDFEFLIGNETSNDVSIVYGKGDGSFLDNPALPVFSGTNPRPRSLDMDDLDGDGNLDIVTALFVNNTIAVQMGDGTGRFAAAVEFPATASPHDLAIGDINGDNIPDVVVTENGAGRVVLLPGQGDGSFAAPQPIDNTTTALAVEIADVDGDSHADLILADGSNVVIRFGLSDGTFADSVTISTVSGTALVEDDYLQAIDFDGDGDLDLVTARSVFRILTNDGSRQFTLTSVATDIASTTVAKAKAADLNGDGFLDLVGLGSGPAFQPTSDRSGIVVRLSDGAGGFLAGQAFNAGGQTQDGFAITDFNLDGILDVVTSTAADNNVAVLIGDGAGSFLPAEYFNIRSGSESSLAVGDIDRDGDVDIVTPSFDNRNVTLLFNHTVAPCLTQTCQATFEYDAGFNQLTRSVDELGRQRLFEIDPVTGNTLRETTVLGLPDATSGETDDLVTQFTYTAQGLIDTTTDPLGRVTDFTYDAFGRLVVTTFAVGTADEAVRRFEYDAAGNQTAAIDENGHRTEFEYDARDRIVLIRDALGGESKFTYDARGNVIRSVDELGQQTDFEYDTMNRVVRQIDDVGNATTFEYDNFGNVLRQVDRLGRVTQFRYDARNRLIEIIDAEGGRSLIEYDADNNAVGLIDENGHTTRFAYDQRNQGTHRFDPLGGLQRTLIDAAGFSITDYDELGRRTDNFRDDADRLIEIQHPDPDGDGPAARPIWQFQYDDAGNKTSETDPRGNLTQFVYDNRDRLIQQIEADPDDAGPLGSPITTFEYDDRSLLTKQTDTLGRVTTFEYDALQRVIRTTAPDPDGAGAQTAPITEITYDAASNVTRVVDPLGNATTFEYDSLNRRIRTTQPDPDGTGPLLSPILSVEYDAEGQVVATTDPLDRTTRFEYDRLGRTTRQIDPDPDGAGPLASPVTQFIFDPVGNVTAMIDANGNRTDLEYDALDRLVRTLAADPDGAGPKERPVSQQIFDTASQLIAEIDPLGRRTDFTHDGLSRLVEIVKPDPDGAGPESRLITQFEIDLIGNITAIVDPLGNRIEHVYDNLNRLVQVTQPDPDGAGPETNPVSTIEFDAAGQVLSSTDPLGRVTRFMYDNLGRTIQQTAPDPDGTGSQASPSESFVYDLVDNLLSTTDALGHATTFTYDNLYRQLTETDANSDTTNYEYDLIGRRTAVVDPLNNRTAYQYDDLDRLIVTTDPLGGTTRFAYDPVNNLLERTDRLGRVIQFTYDDLDRRVSEQWLDAGNVVRTLDYEYDIASQLLSDSEPSATNTYQYDGLGRVVTAAMDITGFTETVTFDYQYDAIGNKLRQAARIGNVNDFVNQHSYDNMHRRTQTTQSTGGGNAVAAKRIDFTYDSASQMQTLDRFADLVGTQLVASSTYVFDLAGRLTDLTHAKGDVNLADYTWTYDAANRITSFDSLTDGLATFNYDARNQLTTADYAAQDDLAFTYDENGNRIGGGNVVGANNRTSSDETFDYEYDAEGNRVLRTNRTTGAVTDYSWDHRNRLIQVVERPSAGAAASRIVMHAYDTMNRWVSSVVDLDGDGPNAAQPRFYFHEGNNVVLQFDGATASDLAHRYLWGVMVDQVLADEQVADPAQPGDILWTLGDNQSTIRDLVEYDSATDTSTVVNHKQYDAFGNVTAETNAAIDSLFGYTGRPFDEATGLQNNLNRWYDAVLGKWLSEDPIGFEAGDANLYRYVGNGPIVSVDPTGNLAEVLGAVTVGGKVLLGATETAKLQVLVSQTLAQQSSLSAILGRAIAGLPGLLQSAPGALAGEVASLATAFAPTLAAAAVPLAIVGSELVAVYELYVAQQRFAEQAARERAAEEKERQLDQQTRERNAEVRAQIEKDRDAESLRISLERRLEIVQDDKILAQHRLEQQFLEQQRQRRQKSASSQPARLIGINNDEGNKRFDINDLLREKPRPKPAVTPGTSGPTTLEQFFAQIGENDPTLGRQITPGTSDSNSTSNVSRSKANSQRIATELGLTGRNNCPPEDQKK